MGRDFRFFPSPPLTPRHVFLGSGGLYFTEPFVTVPGLVHWDEAMKPKPRVAIYARYSSEIQSPLSISGQIALCRRLIEREFDVDGGLAAVFSDAEITGRTVLGRPGLQLLLEAAERKEFDVVVAEDLSRFSRTLRDTDEIYERLEHRGVALYTAHEGWVSQIDIGFKGTMNAIFLTDMKAKVRRGQRAPARRRAGSHRAAPTDTVWFAASSTAGTATSTACARSTRRRPRSCGGYSRNTPPANPSRRSSGI